MNIALALKLLDLAMIGFAAYDRFQARRSENEAELNQIRRMREDVLTGVIGVDELDVRVNELIDRLHAARRSAFESLPKPQGHIDD